MMKLPKFLVLSLIVLVITLVVISRVIGQSKTQAENAEPQATAISSSPELRIAQDIAFIRDGERRGIEPLKLGRLWAHLAWDYQDEMDLAKSEAAYIHALRLMEPVPEAQKDYRIVLDNLGSVYLVWGKFDESERCRKRALAVREATADKLEVAQGKSLLAEVHLGQHKYKEAHREALESYTAIIAMKDPDTSAVFPTLVTLIYAECTCGQCAAAALEHAREALSLARSNFAADSPEVAQAHMALGFAEWKTGMKDGPDEEMRTGVEIAIARPSWTNPYALLVSALEQYRSYLVSVHRKQEASEIGKKLAQVEGSLQPKVCSNCTVSMFGLQGK